ncbi:hypothetical protein GCM10027203_75080 [Nonomuraea fastidiosa]
MIAPERTTRWTGSVRSVPHAGRRGPGRQAAGATSPTGRLTMTFRRLTVFIKAMRETRAASCSSSAVGKSPAAVRQIAHRARAHVAARRPRDAASPAEARAVLAAFQRAVETGDLQSLFDLLAPDVVALSDTGGLKQNLPRPLSGADRVARLLATGLRMLGTRLSFQPAHVNGSPALLVRIDGEIDGVMAVRVESGLITGLYFVRNPDKLSRVRREPDLPEIAVRPPRPRGGEPVPGAGVHRPQGRPTS